MKLVGILGAAAAALLMPLAGAAQAPGEAPPGTDQMVTPTAPEPPVPLAPPVLVPVPPPAAPAPPARPVAEAAPAEVSVLIFARYGFAALGEPEGVQGFALDRGYLDVRARAGDAWSVRLTPDLVAPRDAGGHWFIRLKYGWIEGRDLTASGLWLRAGMLDTPFADPYDKHWGNRVLVPSPLEAAGLIQSADLGVSVGQPLGPVTLRLWAFNGEGYSSPELAEKDRAAPDLALQAAIDAGGGLGVTVTGHTGWDLGGDRRFATPGPYDRRVNGVLLLTWTGGVLRAGAEAALLHRVPEGGDGLNGLSLSAYTVLMLHDRVQVPLRFDRFDPDLDGTEDETLRAIAAVSVRLNDDVRLLPALRWERVGDADATGVAGLHLEGRAP